MRFLFLLYFAHEMWDFEHGGGPGTSLVGTELFLGVERLFGKCFLQVVYLPVLAIQTRRSLRGLPFIPSQTRFHKYSGEDGPCA